MSALPMDIVWMVKEYLVPLHSRRAEYLLMKEHIDHVWAFNDRCWYDDLLPYWKDRPQMRYEMRIYNEIKEEKLRRGDAWIEITSSDDSDSDSD